MRYPELTDDQRQLLFDIMETAQEAGPDYDRIVALVSEWSGGRQINLQVYRTFDKPHVSKTCQAGYVTLTVLEDKGYLKIDPRRAERRYPEIALTQLAQDYFRWYQKPRAYKAISSWWASLSGEERGVIIALVIPPLAGILFRLGQRFVEHLLTK